MSISINWETKVIMVPRLDMGLAQSFPSEIRNLNLNSFRLELKALEASPAGVPYLDTHKHNTIVTLGGVTFARLIELVNNYVVEFEDGQYAVNLIGANSNVGDNVVVNQVSVRSANSAGLVEVAGSTAVTPANVAAQVRLELAVELARIDVILSTRATPADIVALS